MKKRLDLQLKRRLERSERRSKKLPTVEATQTTSETKKKKKRAAPTTTPTAPSSEENDVRKRLRARPVEQTDASKTRPSERDEATASRSSNDPLGLNDLPRVVDGQFALLYPLFNRIKK